MIEFIECAKCRAKPGSPTLCGDCLLRRAAESGSRAFREYEESHRAAREGRIESAMVISLVAMGFSVLGAFLSIWGALR